jgi:insulysin
MIAFYKHFISPSSPNRAKLSVHLVAQASSNEGAANEALVGTVQQFLTASGVAVDQANLTTRLQGIDPTTDAGVENFVQGITAYLTQDASVPAEKAAAIVGSGKSLLQLSLANGSTTTGKEDAKDGAVGVRKAVKIEDVRAWKTSLRSSPGPMQVKDLSEFEDFDPKL